MNRRFRLFCATAMTFAAAASLGACRSGGDIVVDQSVGITAVRSPCPAVGIPDYTGDVTRFRAPGNRTAANIDMVAAMTRVRAACNDTGEKIVSTATFEVQARRTDTSTPQQVTLPYFVTVLRGGSAVVSKRIGTVTLDFAAGQERASAQASGSAYIDRAAATLPEEIRKRIIRKRKAGDADAAIDPLSEPEVRAAVERASFELLVGFQLSEDELAYNATR